MTKTIYVCDCCGTEVSHDYLHTCCKELRTLDGYKCASKTWELCENCIDRLETAMMKEADRIANSSTREAIDSLRQDEPPDDMYAGGHGIEVGQ